MSKTLGKYFFIRSLENGLVLEAGGAASYPGNNVTMGRQNPTLDGNQHQLWYEDSTTKTIRSAMNDYCLSAAGATPGSPIALNSYQPGNLNQQWIVLEPVHSEKTISSLANMQLVVDAEGSLVYLRPQRGSLNQKWTFQHQPAWYFYIESQMNSKVVDVLDGNRSPGAQVLMHHRHPYLVDNQLWYEDTRGIIRSKMNDFAFDSSTGRFLLHPNDPYHPDRQWAWGADGRIHKLSSATEVMNIRDASDANCAEVVPYSFMGTQNQLWRRRFADKTPRYFFITSQLNGKVADVMYQSHTPGTKIIMHGRHLPAMDHQLWYEDSSGFIRSKMNDFTIDSSTGVFTIQPYNPSMPEGHWMFGPDGRINKAGYPDFVMNIRGASSEDMAELVPYHFKGSADQLWKKEYTS